MDNLVFDRTQADVTYATELNRKLGSGEALTPQELADWNAGLKGTYNATDMNRVDAAVRELGGLLTAAGYPVRYTLPVPQPKPEYTPLSYIESTGTQYIDTGYKPNSNTRVVITGSNLPISSKNKGLFGARQDLSTDTYCFFSLPVGYRSDYGKSKVGYDVSINIKDDFSIDKNKNVCSINDKSVNNEVEDFQCDYNLYLFCINTAGKAELFADGAKIYACKIYEGEILIRDYVPAEKNGIIGLYDKVSRKMYGNSGTGEFISNASYTELTYIESTGTQYIDTGFKPNNNTTIVANVEITNADTDYIGLFGARDGSTKQMWAYYDTTTSQWSARYNTESKKINGNYSGKHTISIKKNIFVIDGTEYNFSAATFTSAYTAYIFAINSSGAVQYPAKMKIYDCQIYDNGVLVRDYISAIQNGSVGLYERVENKMYLNAGTGEFIAGKVVPQPEPPPLPVVTEFSVGDIINYDIWRTYIDNVQALRDAYYVMKDTPDLPEPTAPLKFDGANAIEKLIFDVQVLYYAMLANYRKCGTFQSGTNTQRLPLQRGVT